MATHGSQFARLGALCLAIALSLCGSAALAQFNANVEFSSISEIDPHPVTYTWNGKKEPIVDPTHYYTFYYTGTVDPDARVSKEVLIERIAVAQDEWEANYKWIVVKLKYYYQLTKNLPPTALGEMSGEVSVVAPPTLSSLPNLPTTPNNPATPPIDPTTGQPFIVDPATGQYMTIDPNTGQQTPVDPNAQQPLIDPQTGQPLDPTLTPNQQYYQNPQLPNFNPNNPNNPQTGATFDAQAAAEWTFFYDQLVLWQYYCARQILNREEELLEPAGAAAAPKGGDSGSLNGRRPGNSGPQGQFGIPPNNEQAGAEDGISMLDMAATIQPGEAGKQTIEAIRKRARMAQNEAIRSGYGNTQMPDGSFMPQGPGGMPFSGGAQPETAVRETFVPTLDFANPDRALEYRFLFEEAAKTNEENLHKKFLVMITDIEQREMNQDQYDQWLDKKRKDLYGFAEDWRKAEDGEVFMSNDTLFVITKDPSEPLPLNAVGIPKADRVTPQDIINEDGTVKRPTLD